MDNGSTMSHPGFGISLTWLLRLRWITAVAPASAAVNNPSGNGKNASEATTEPIVGLWCNPKASAISPALRAAIRVESTLLICPAPTPTVAPSFT